MEKKNKKTYFAIRNTVLKTLLKEKKRRNFANVLML